MRMVVVLLFPLFLLVVAEASEAVLDANGDPVMANKSYFIRDARVRNLREYIIVLEALKNYCDVAVGSEQIVMSRYSVSFHPADASETILLSADLNVAFNSPIGDVCGGTVWWVGNGTWRRFVRVGVGAQLGNPGAETERNWFKIEKHPHPRGRGRAYMLVYSPTVCGGSPCPGVTSGYVTTHPPYVIVTTDPRTVKPLVFVTTPYQ